MSGCSLHGWRVEHVIDWDNGGLDNMGNQRDVRERSRNLIIEKCLCFQCWEKSFCVKKVLWTKHTEWRTKSQFLHAMPTCVWAAPPTEERPGHSSPALMAAGKGQEQRSWSFLSNDARQIKLKEFSSTDGREHQNSSLLGARFGR